MQGQAQTQTQTFSLSDFNLVSELFSVSGFDGPSLLFCDWVCELV
jgi:hypothetical protein